MVSTPDDHHDYEFRVASAIITRELAKYVRYLYERGDNLAQLDILNQRLLSPSNFRVCFLNFTKKKKKKLT